MEALKILPFFRDHKLYAVYDVLLYETDHN